MGLDQCLFKVSSFGELGSVFWWVELDLFPLECNEVSSGELAGAGEYRGIVSMGLA